MAAQNTLFRMADLSHRTMHELQRITRAQRRAALEPAPEDWRARLPGLLRDHLNTESEPPQDLDWSPLLTAAMQLMLAEAHRALMEGGVGPDVLRQARRLLEEAGMNSTQAIRALDPSLGDEHPCPPGPGHARTLLERADPASGLYRLVVPHRVCPGPSAETPPACAVCLEALDTAPHSAMCHRDRQGCGRELHDRCRPPSPYCVICARDRSGHLRPAACRHGSWGACRDCEREAARREAGSPAEPPATADTAASWAYSGTSIPTPPPLPTM